MLPDPLSAIEESVASLESRLDDHLKVYQTSTREKDTTIVSIRKSDLYDSFTGILGITTRGFGENQV